ncbi:MAG: hypothetical protein HYY40_09330 [Bacteroidetes bacterium]|nr:hypothetical protein [Bacteroidota bacterium]
MKISSGITIIFYFQNIFLSLVFAQIPRSGSDSLPQWMVFTTRNSKIPGNRITAITQDPNELLFFSFGGKIWAFNGTKWKNYYKPPSWSGEDDIKKMVFDNTGVMWAVGTNNRTAFYEDEHWSELNQKNSPLPDGKVTDMAIDLNNIKWFTTSGDGLIRYDGNAFILMDTMCDVPDTNFISVAIDRNNIFWLLSSAGLVKFSNDSVFELSENFKNPELPGKINFFGIGSDNRIWMCGGNNFSVRGGGIAVFDGLTTFRYSRQNSSLTSDCVNSIAWDNNGTLWAGNCNCSGRDVITGTKIFYRGGVARPLEPVTMSVNISFMQFINASGNALNTLPGLRSEEENRTLARNVNVIFVDKDNNKWIGTDNGLFVYNEKGVVVK